MLCVDGDGNVAWCIVNAKNQDCIDKECGVWNFLFYDMKHYNDAIKLHPQGWLAYCEVEKNHEPQHVYKKLQNDGVQ